MTAVALREGSIFIKKKHELDPLLKEVEKGGKGAVALLIATMEDDKLPLKVRLDAGNKLLDYQIQIADIISRDSLVRQVAEIKATGLKTPLEQVPGNGKPLPPRLDMNNIQDVG